MRITVLKKSKCIGAHIVSDIVSNVCCAFVVITTDSCHATCKVHTVVLV